MALDLGQLTAAETASAAAVGTVAIRPAEDQAAFMEERYQPETIEVVRDAGVTITFIDGFVARFDLLTLRLGCPCASCRGMRDLGEVVWPRPGSPTPLRIENAELHGAWGLAISWNDGHNTGIFPFEWLRRSQESRH
jgi:ATP-binding protein involved in chromosome partitioning